MRVFLRDDIENISQEEMKDLLERLPDWRLESALRFRHLAGRRENAAAFLLLSEALHDLYGISPVPPFAYGEHGKPYIPDYPNIYFNMSHCRKAVACAIDENPVGVDIEVIRSVKPGLVRYTMNGDEQQRIFGHPQPDMEFTRLWTRKEAVLKLAGEGVGSQMHDILLPERLERQGIQVGTFEGNGYVYSIAEKLV